MNNTLHPTKVKRPNSEKVYPILWDITQEIFKAVKMYDCPYKGISDLLEGEHGDAIFEALEILENVFYTILNKKK